MNNTYVQLHSLKNIQPRAGRMSHSLEFNALEPEFRLTSFFGFFCILPHFFCVAANTAVNQLCPLMTSELTVHGLKHSLVKSTCP